MNGYVLSLCDESAVMVRPWAEAGYKCICVDLHERPNEPGITHVAADVTQYVPPLREYAAVFAFPPCTHLSVSGARWFVDKGLEALHEALGIVLACKRICEASGAPWMLENPVSTLSSYWRKPDHTFDPCDYGDPYTKKTCLWTGGGFVMPPKCRVEPTDIGRIHRMPPSPERAMLRSRTPAGFARAVFQANAPSQAFMHA